MFNKVRDFYNNFYFLENNFFSRFSLLKDKIVTFEKFKEYAKENSDKTIDSIDENTLYEYKAEGDSKSFLFKIPSGTVYSCLFTLNSKKPADALKVTFGPIKKEIASLTFREAKRLTNVGIRETEKQISSKPEDIKKIFSVIYTILLKLYYPKYKKVAFRATLLSSEKPFKDFYDFLVTKNKNTIKTIIDLIEEKTEEIKEKFENEKDLKRFLKLKETFINNLEKKRKSKDILTKQEIIEFFNDFEKNAFFRHRIYKTAINLSLPEISREIKKEIEIEFDYDLTDRYIVLKVVA